MIRYEKRQYDIDRKAAKISALSSGKIDKYEYLTGEEILPFDQKRVIEQAKFAYSLLEKAFEKHIKTIKDQRIKQIEALKALEALKSEESLKALKPEENQEMSVEGHFRKNARTDEIKNEIDEIRKREKN